MVHGMVHGMVYGMVHGMVHGMRRVNIGAREEMRPDSLQS